MCSKLAAGAGSSRGLAPPPLLPIWLHAEAAIPPSERPLTTLLVLASLLCPACSTVPAPLAVAATSAPRSAIQCDTYTPFHAPDLDDS